MGSKFDIVYNEYENMKKKKEKFVFPHRVQKKNINPCKNIDGDV